MKKKVLLVSPYSAKNVGGIGTWTKNILEYQEKRNNDFEIIKLNSIFRFKPNLQNKKFNRILFGTIEGVSILALLLTKIIQHRPKTIHYTSSASFALLKDLCATLIAKTFRIKFVIHFMCGRIPEIYGNQNLEWKLLKMTLFNADTIIVLDSLSFNELNKLGYSNTVKIPNPISKELYYRALKNESKTKSIEVGTIIFIGHIIPEKGVYELIEACTRNKKVNKLLMIGPVLEITKTELINISKKRNEGDWLIFKGTIENEELFNYLEVANALCLPSYTEGFPNVILEAMVSCCPVISTKVGAVEEIIISEEFGNAGICIERKNIEQLYDSLNMLISNLDTALEYGRNGNKAVISKYTMNIIYSQYESIW